MVFWKRLKTGTRRVTVGGQLFNRGIGADSPRMPTFLSAVPGQPEAGIAVFFDGFETENDHLLNFVGRLRESLTELGLDFNDPDSRHLSN